MNPRFAILAVLGCLFAAGLAGASSARAGTYDVLACDGAPGSANNSWSPALQLADAVLAFTACPASGDPLRGIVARNVVSSAGSSVSQGAVAQWLFRAPAGTAIDGLTASYRFYHASSGWEAALSDGAHIIRGCATGSGACDVSSPGEWIPLGGLPFIYIDVYCGAGPCPISSTGDAGHTYVQAIANLYSAAVRLEDDSAPTIGAPAGGLWSSGWLSGLQTYSFASTDNAGVRETRVLIDGSVITRTTRPCDFSQPVPCPSGSTSGSLDTRLVHQDGMHVATIQSEDPAGNVGQVTRQVAIDNSPPGSPSHLAVDGGDGWRNTNSFSVSWRNPAQSGTAPIAGAAYDLCPSTGPATACHQGAVAGQDVASIPKLAVPGTGDWKLSVWLRDAAGNADPSTAAEAVHLRFDDQAPASANFAAADPSDPTKIAVDATDTGSGIAGGAIEYKKHVGTAWHGIATQILGGQVVGHINDEDLSNGVYDLRAHVDDAAGNERATTTTATGAPETLTLPLRLPTHLVAGRRSHRGKRVRYSARLHLRFRHRVRLRGHLTNGTGAPFVDTPVVVLQRVHVPGAVWTPVAQLQTSKTGGFVYTAPAGLSRTLRFRYLGTPTIRSSHRDVVLDVAAASTFHVSRHSVVNGDTVRLHGRLRGGHFPAGGKLVAIQVFLRGSWHTFATTRSHAHGRWHYDYRFTGTRGHQIYRFRAMLPHEATYPFATGVSNTARVLVRGV